LLCLDLVEHVNSLESLLVELEEVIEVGLDVIKWQVNEHACNLWSLLLTDDLFNKLVDELSDHGLEVRVSWNDGRDQSDSLLVVFIDVWVWVSQVSHLLNNNGLAGWLLRDDLWWYHWAWLGHLWHALWASVVVDTWWIAATWWSVASLHSWAPSVLELVREASVVAHHLVLDEHEDLLNELDGVRSGQNGGVNWGSSGLSVIHEIISVLCLSLLLLTNLWKFVIGNI